MTDKPARDKKVAEFVANVISERAALARLAGMQFGGIRDVDAVLGYKQAPNIDDYKAVYDRRGLAATIVDAPAKTTWRRRPDITDGSDGKSDFMKQFEALRKRLSIYHYLQRADRLSGIGRYGVILIGTKEKNGKLSEPLDTVDGPEDVVFLSVFSEVYSKIATWEQATDNPRFGHPKTYTLDLSSDMSMGAAALGSQVVDWTRVIHIAEGLLENEVYGEPRLQKVFNYLQDLDKIVGSSAEGYWQSAVKAFTLGNKEGYEFDEKMIAAAKEDMQEYIHGLQRILAMEGIDVGELKGTIMDPTPAFNVVISMICGTTGIPQRILLGSERGNLASSQDEANWLGRIAERREQHAEPRILRALIDRLVSIKALAAPQGGEYTVEWPGLFQLTDDEQADVYLKRAEAISTVSAKAPLDLFQPSELREAVGFTPEPEGQQPTTQEAEVNEDDPEAREQFQIIMRGGDSNDRASV